MSENTEIRAAMESLAAEPLSEQIDYYRKPFMVLWAAIQEAASGVAEDYDLPTDMAQLWVAEQMRQVADSLVDRLAEKAVSRGASTSNVARAAALLSASQQAPLMAMCLVMELTEAPSAFFVPVGLAVAASSLVSKWMLSRRK